MKTEFTSLLVALFKSSPQVEMSRRDKSVSIKFDLFRYVFTLFTIFEKSKKLELHNLDRLANETKSERLSERKRDFLSVYQTFSTDNIVRS